MLTRRQTLLAATATVVIGIAGVDAAHAADKVVKIGIDLSLTGADSQGAGRVKNAIVMAFDAANEGNAIPGYKFELLVTDDGTATAGQYDPAQAATNARKMVADKEVVAAIGPQMSGAGKAMAPILSQGGLATITPVVDQSRHHQPEVRRAVSPGRQADLLPHRDDRRLPGSQHGELLRREAEGEVGLHPGRQRRVRRRAWRMHSRSRPRRRGSRSSAATGWIRRPPTTRRS